MSELPNQADGPDRGRGGPAVTMTAEEFAGRNARLRWTGLLLLAVALAVVCGMLVFACYRPVYEASAWLKIEDTKPFIAFPTDGDSRRFVATQVELIRSPLVLGPILADPDVTRLAEAEKEEDPMRWLQEGVQVSAVGRSELYKVSFSSHDRKGSADVVNAVVDAYFDLQGKTESEQTARKIELLELESQRRADDVQRLQTTLRTLAENAAIVAGTPDPNAAPGPSENRLQDRLVDAQIEHAILAAEVKAFQESLFGLGVCGTTSDEGTANIALAGDNNDMVIKPKRSIPAIGGVRILLESNEAANGQAIVKYDPVERILHIDIDPLATTASTVVEQIDSETIFAAELDDKTQDPANDGSGLVCRVETDVAESSLEEAIGEDPRVQQLSATLRATQARLLELKNRLPGREDEPLYKEADEKFNKDKAELDLLREQLLSRMKDEACRAMERERVAELAEMRSELTAKALLVSLLQDRCRAENPQVRPSSGDTVEIDFTKRDLARAEEVFERIESQIVALRTEQRAPARVTKMQGAAAPTEPIKGRPVRHIALASLAGFCLPLVIVGLRVPLRRAKRARCREDPVFGPLRFRRPKSWHGMAGLEPGSEVRVSVTADRRGPGAAAREGFVELRRRYAALQPEIADALFGLYGNARAGEPASNQQPALPELSEPLAIWQHARLEAVRVEPSADSESGHLVLEYGVDWDRRCRFHVFLWQWQVVRAAAVER